MPKSILIIVCCLLLLTADAQVKMGYDPTSVNPAAVLELSNNPAAAPSAWKAFIPPGVDFTNAVFTSSSVWGIAGSPTPGAIVYNSSENYSNGFAGAGLYCWQRNSWALISTTVTDKIRAALSTNLASYDASPAGYWVTVTATEYNNLVTVVNGAAQYGISEIFMNSTPDNSWIGNFTIGGNVDAVKVPANNYIIALLVKTGSLNSTSAGSKLKISSSQLSSYTDYGPPLPNVATAGTTRLYFVLKKPSIITSSSPTWTSMYNSAFNFLGLSTTLGVGPEYYGSGDNNTLTTSNASDSYLQVISTANRQW